MGHLWKHPTDLMGQRFGRLVVLEEAPRRGEQGSREYWRRRWMCLCDCGTRRTVAMGELRNEQTTSCGCWQREDLGNRRRIHGRTHTTEYRIWAGMKARCYNENSQHYADYGGRRISVCARWLDSFEHFYADMGPKPTGKTLDRRDNSGNYTPDNCRWATPHEQRLNSRPKRKGVILLSLNGRTQSLTEWAQELGIKKRCLDSRIRNGWSVHRALST